MLCTRRTKPAQLRSSPQANLTVFQGSQRFQQPIGLLGSASSVGVTEGRIADRCTKEFKVVEMGSVKGAAFTTWIL